MRAAATDEPRRLLRLPWTLWRHLGLATCWPFLLLFAALSGALLLLFALRIGELAPAASFGLGDLLPIFGYGLPHLSLLTLPVTFLAGVLLAYGQFAADGGYVAARSAGIGPLRLAAPALGLGLVLSVVTLALTLWAEPWGNRGLRHELVRLGKVGMIAGLRPGLFNEALREVTVYVESKGPEGELRHIFLHDRRDPRQPVVALARRGRLRADPGRDLLFMELEDGELQSRTEDGRVFRRVTFGRYRFDLDVAGLLEQRIAFSGAAQAMNVAELERAIAMVRKMGHPTWRWELALHRKYALPWVATLFAIFGVGLGLGRVRAPRIRASLAALALVALTYTLQRTGDGLAARDQVPVVVAAWLPYLILFPVALGLLWRRIRGLE